MARKRRRREMLQDGPIHSGGHHLTSRHTLIRGWHMELAPSLRMQGTQARIRGGDLFFMVDMPEGNFYSLCLLCLNTKIETFLDNSNMFGFGWVGELVCPCCHLPLLVPFALRA
eukprot:247965-Pelagomonas_calceolata.AAC.4